MNIEDLNIRLHVPNSNAMKKCQLMLGEAGVTWEDNRYRGKFRFPDRKVITVERGKMWAFDRRVDYDSNVQLVKVQPQDLKQYLTKHGFLTGQSKGGLSRRETALFLLTSNSVTVSKLLSAALIGEKTLENKALTYVQNIAPHIFAGLRGDMPNSRQLVSDLYQYFVEKGDMTENQRKEKLKGNPPVEVRRECNLPPPIKDNAVTFDNLFKPTTLIKESTMFTYEKKTFINGSDAIEFSEDGLFATIQDAQNEIKRLQGIKPCNRPKKVSKRIKSIEAFIQSVKAYTDRRA